MLYWVTTLVLLVYLVLVWLLGRWLPLHGSDVWILRGVLALLGLIGAGGRVFLSIQSKEGEGGAPGKTTPNPAATDDLDALGARGGPATEAFDVGARNQPGQPSAGVCSGGFGFHQDDSSSSFCARSRTAGGAGVSGQ